MIVDTSAIVAIIREESDADRCARAILRSAVRRVSAGNLLEAYIVVDSSTSDEQSRQLETLLARFQMVVEPVTREQVDIARIAYQRYGKGSRHPAHLNYGDCFAHALAKHRDEPLLFIGNDFVHTDIEVLL